MAAVLDLAVLAGVCGKPGDMDGTRIAAEFNIPVDLCVHSSGVFIVFLLYLGHIYMSLLVLITLWKFLLTNEQMQKA